LFHWVKTVEIIKVLFLPSSYIMDFSPLQSFFDHIYVITVEAAIERQAKIKEELAGLHFTFFIGAYKKDFTIDELIEANLYDEEKAKRLHRFNKPMNTSQIGQAWTHRLVYEDMLENNYEKVLILEDDIIVNKDGMSKIEDMLKQIPANWEVWYLDYHKNLKRDLGTWFIQQSLHAKRMLGKVPWSHKQINNLYARKFQENLLLAGCHEFASAYGITRSAARKLVKLQTPICFPSDQLLSYACSNLLVYGFISVPKVFLNESQLQDKKNKAYLVE
jgi:glycosyl transferase, family 25